MMVSENQVSYRRNEFSLKENLAEIFFVLIIVIFPWSINLPNYLIIMLILVKVLTFNKDLDLKSLKDNMIPILVNISPFVFILISLLYTSSFREGIKSFERYSLLLVFPLILPCLRLKKDITFYLKIFATTLIVMCTICLIYNSFIFFSVPLEEQSMVGDAINKVDTAWNAFTNENLVRPFDIHPVYMSMYLVLVMGIIAFEKNIDRRLKVWVLIFLVVFQVLLASRVGIFAILACAVLLFFLYAARIKKIQILVLIGLVSAGFIVMLFFNPILKKRYINDFNSFQTPENVSNWNGANIRYTVWKCSVEAFTQSPIIGYGVGAENIVREKCYTNYTFYGVFGTTLNSHNQFLEFSLIGGVILLVLFIGQLFYSATVALKYNSVLFLLFVTSFVVICLAESVLQRHKGVIFFSLFNSLFLGNFQSYKKGGR